MMRRHDEPPGPEVTGELARLIAAFDWTSTALGPRDRWPLRLVYLVEMMLESPRPMVLVWGNDVQLIYNDAYAEFAGSKHPGILGANVFEAWPEVADLNAENLRRALAGESFSYADIELELDRHGTKQACWLNIDYSPIRDDGIVQGFFALLTETTTRVKAERERAAAEEAYRSAREHVELALDAGAVVGTFIWDIATDTLTFDRRFAHTFGLPDSLGMTGVPNHDVAARIHPDDMPQVEAGVYEAMATHGTYRCEYRVSQADGSFTWVEASGRVQYDEAGAPQRLPGILVGIQERKLAEQQQRILVNELNHRVKNTLAIVQSLAMQSFPRTEGNAPATAAFTARLVALAKAHDVLNQSSWGQTSLADVVATAIGPFMGHDEPRFVTGGDEVSVDPQLSLALSMAFHELCTNAVKYGALGVPGGYVTIHWQRDADDRIDVLWREQGGPPVVEPTRQGFGTRLIRHSVGSRNDAQISLDFAPEGVRCSFSLRLPAVTPG